MQTPRTTPNRPVTPIVISPGSVGQRVLPTPTNSIFRDTIFSRPATGSVRSQSPIGNLAYLMESSTSEDSSNAVMEDSDTGSVWSPSPARRLWARSETSSERTLDTLNQQGPLLRTSTSGSWNQELESIFN